MATSAFMIELSRAPAAGLGSERIGDLLDADIRSLFAPQEK